MKYIFRGVEVFIYDPKTKQIRVPNTEGNNFNYCKYIPEDYKLIAEFFNLAHQHAMGIIKDKDLKEFEVY